jgi:hypothetical protein
MKCNVGKKERLVWAIAGLLFVGTGIVWGRLTALLGAPSILTAIIEWCPVSRLLGISTCMYDEDILAVATDQYSGRQIKDLLLR